MSQGKYPAIAHATRVFNELQKLLPANLRSKKQIFLLSGEVTGYRHDTDRELVFRQESNFYYLSGCAVPSSSLIISSPSSETHPNDAAPTVTLYIPKADLADLMWSVPPPDLEQARQLFSVSQIEYTESLPEALSTLISSEEASGEGVVYHTLPAESPLFPSLPTSVSPILTALTSSDASPTAPVLTDAFLLSALHKARLIKDDYEIAEIRKANEISSRAHETVMRVLGKAVKGEIERTANAGPGGDRPLLPGEWLIEKEAEAEAIFVASCRREGAVHQAYLPIVAASNRAATLHYCCNDREFAWGPVKPTDHLNRNDLAHTHTNHDQAQGQKELAPQVLLIDAGCEWNCYASDITRTMPVGNGGKFSPEARDVYELVLEMQRRAFEIIKPGVHWDTVHLLCHKVLIGGFQKLGLFKSPTSPNSGSWNSFESILASGISSAFFPHGLGHSLGMDVHDVPSASKPKEEENTTIPQETKEGWSGLYTYLRLRLPLEEKMVVTVEPGIYFSPHLIAPWRDSPHLDLDVLKRYENMGGVRIEDVALITKDGYENLTKVGSKTEWVEKVCSGEL